MQGQDACEAVVGHIIDANRAVLTVAEASRLSGYNRAHVNYLIVQHYIDAVRVGSVWLVYEDSLRHYMIAPRKPGPKPGRTGESEQISDGSSGSSVPNLGGNAGN
jgi:hypothetical protein